MVRQAMMQRRAQCSCGQLRLTASGEPLRVSICHCLACQRRTGSVAGVQARFPLDRVQTEGESSEFVRTAESGNRISFHFCPQCGSTVYLQLDSEPELIGVPVGAFADPGFPAPTASIYEEHHHTWVPLPEDIEHWH